MKYRVIFVHGMFGWGENEGINKFIPYWGATTGSIIEYLLRNSVECYSASVGPMSSAWDQACELYAQLMGTTVDYGEYHSRKFAHKRFGRTYNLLVRQLDYQIIHQELRQSNHCNQKRFQVYQHVFQCFF